MAMMQGEAGNDVPLKADHPIANWIKDEARSLKDLAETAPCGQTSSSQRPNPHSSTQPQTLP